MLSHTCLLIDISSSDLVCSIVDKRDAFDFDGVNFPDLFGNIPTAPVYGTYISQLLRYNRVSHNYDNFSSLHSMLAVRRFSQRKLMGITFYQFISRYPELTSKFNKSPSSVMCDSVPMGQLHHTFPQVMK